jgi:hypothetical protein
LIKRAILIVVLLSVSVAVMGCAGTGATASIDTNSVGWHNLSGYGFPSWSGFVVPVTVTPIGVPKSDVTYVVKLTSRDGYLYAAADYQDTVQWAKGEAATPKTVEFVIKSDDASASHVYDQLYADYRSNNLTTLRKDAATLLEAHISRKTHI